MGTTTITFRGKLYVKWKRYVSNGGAPLGPWKVHTLTAVDDKKHPFARTGLSETVIEVTNSMVLFKSPSGNSGTSLKLEFTQVNLG
jgi:hypothetical protein